MTKKIIGRTDCIDFPKLNLLNINCKIDTGAYTSSIHCSNITLTDQGLLCFFDDNKTEKSEPILFKEYSLTDVKSSNGFVENRYKIKTDVVFFGKTYKINLTLSTRSDMRFPVLIGRQFLKRKFLVDVDLQNQSFNKKVE
ncbi:RimK/LysX family protein [Mesoflavibacter zeaxanthinifaciens]|uniref:ATP-dependent zinc protease family protein n=1 Tax=Mesoflavibacter zeaxanthinifaciens TaxID=393060 RepID=UPI0026EA89F9|nr:RimK/LysX family protein [Mesoflavibacter zeaxanthinifaciens]